MITPAECNPNKRRKLSSGKPAPHPMGFDNVPAFERPLELCIEGTIPHWVNGVLYRGGR
jgi:torulene dioxygenase